MALSDILAKIEKQTKEKIIELEKEFEKKKAALEKEALEKREKIDHEMREKIEENSKKIIEKAESLAERESKNSLLRAKREIIDEALEEAISELAKIGNYEKIITEMLKSSPLEGDHVTVVPPKGKEEETKNAIRHSGKAYFLSEKSADIAGGFIVKTDKIEIDNSFETIINNQLREDLEIKLNKLLF